MRVYIVGQSLKGTFEGGLFSRIVNGVFGLFGLAEGGKVSGPGTGTSDSILARLSHGEYVINAQAASRVGTTFLDNLNTGSIGLYAEGGQVGNNIVVSTPTAANFNTKVAMPSAEFNAPLLDSLSAGVSLQPSSSLESSLSSTSKITNAASNTTTTKNVHVNPEITYIQQGGPGPSKSELHETIVNSVNVAIRRGEIKGFN